MRLLIVSCIAFLLFLPFHAFAQSTELLTSPWHLTGNNGDAQTYQSLSPASIKNKTSLTLTYNLHGLCALGGDASAIIFDQNGWKYISLASYGQNCLDGSQTVTIPLSAFPGLNTTINLTGSFHARFWYSKKFIIDITSAKLNDSASPTPTASPSASPSATPIPTPTPTALPTPTPSPSSVANWSIRSVDAMKYSKDVICNPPSDSTINTMVTRAKNLGANYVAISTPYDSPACGDSLALTTRWVNAIRAQGLHVWHRHMGLAFEGIYNTPKSSANYLPLIVSYITNHPSLFQIGDLFTPTPEPDSAGIGGVTCSSNCAFSSNAAFNQWIRDAQAQTKAAFTSIGLANMKVGYYGTSGFIVYGENNPDWFGKSFLEASTVAAMDNIIAIDDYPESYGGNMTNAMNGAHQVWPNAQLVIGEWGTTTAISSQDAVNQVNSSMPAAIRPYIIGFNYWVLGPSAQEALLNSDLSINPTYTAVQHYFNP